MALSLVTRAASLAQEARTDPLTSLLNRSGLALRAQELLRQPRGHALMLLDLDRFKPVNDVHGHAAGDVVLVEVARRLTQAVREHDAVARLGGDEFVILFADDPGLAALEERAQRLQAALRRPIDISSGQAVSIDSSVGVATSPQDGYSLDELLMVADTALRRAKEAGRGCFRFHDSQGGAGCRLIIDAPLELRLTPKARPPFEGPMSFRVYPISNTTPGGIIR